MSSDTSAGAQLYFDLLKKSLTNTLYGHEPDADDQNQARFLQGFVTHYIKGAAVSMLPLARFDNLERCIATVLADGVAGDFIETGVWRGGATIFMRAALKVFGVTDRIVWVADSFEGLPEPDAQKFPNEYRAHQSAMMTNVNKHFASGLDEVKRNFEAYGMLDDQVRFLQGWFKDSLPVAPIETLAIMRLDGDYYESTMDGLTNLYDKLAVGGFAIIDDYGEDMWTYCRQAVEDFRRERGIDDPIIQVDSKCSFWRKLK
ncbi:MAG: macrocin O-methyltransferase [Acidocella sp.]|nr:macrocin O-methyltransferase [Acidocella sp.]